MMKRMKKIKKKKKKKVNKMQRTNKARLKQKSRTIKIITTKMRKPL